MSRLYLFHQTRVKKIVNIMIFFGIIVLSRYFYIQVISAQDFNKKILKKTEYTKQIKGERGRIYDRNGVLLAGNITKVDLWVNTNKKYDSEKISSFFKKYFDLDSLYTIKKLNNKSKNYLPFKKGIISENLEELTKEVSKIKGLHIDRYSQRFYPYEHICSQLLGYVNQKDIGKSGIELEFNKILKGLEIDEIFEKSINSKLTNKDKANFNFDLNGKDIYLTIDIEIQKFLYEALEKGQHGSAAKSANGIIVDPLNGEVLAIAGTPSYNPNNFSSYNIEKYKNNGISKQYEPGSTIKVIPIIDAINNLDRNMYIDCEDGEFQIPNTSRIIKDHEPHKELTIDEILIHSSNIGIVKISNLLGKEKTYSSLRKFGLGSKTGIELPGEEKGKLRNLKTWSKTTHSAASFGQEVSATNLQLSMIYAAIANNGYLLKPKIVKKISSFKNFIDFNEVQVIRKVMTLDDSKNIISILNRAVSDGTAKNIVIEGYDIAGKTGTAEKFIDGKYSKKEFISSFASIFPSSDPQFVCIISVDSPEYHKHWGNVTAAPIAREIFVEMINNNFVRNNDQPL